MKSHLKSAATLLPFFFLTSFYHLSLSASDSFVYGGCSQIKFDPTSSYQSDLNSIMASAANSASFSAYNNFTTNKSVYGLYQCRNNLPLSECSNCIQTSINQLRALCPNSCGGTIQLQECFLKYDNISFVGVLDTSLIYKRCSPEFSADSGFYERREEVFREIQQVGSNGFSVGSSGTIQGMAQCSGDLEPSDCSACLIQAVGRLRSLCASSVSGDIYLGKCYVRYSSDGFYSSPHGSSNDDGAGKTLAIIIGLLAGVALIIVFLSFLRQVCGKGGGK
ncbi:cysteine-rich repeat secretory protein 60 [Amborella trichopoda]|uniref:Gnk2-homologous domain-containing protein n=1 Tax=Amborella trichopoda TaxID=13333 RepID=W1NFA4_AMBTC|nr:cysteine-rich repeat secretory protein 60 [Amborella trichopoda]ERM94138.1 hypothetical protein AMTR_s00010p00153490 [Amborella trichopoda]|eukprot:XP_006826901.1 cysteine-rich repeat secretory protein 60 [Amborella trichopoda]